MDQLLLKIRKALRLSHDKLDDEIQDLIDASLIDLSLSGIQKRETTDPLIIRAITLYCKASIGLFNSDSEKYMQSYEMLKISLALAGDYNGTV